jgi:hypothetical protein
MTPRLYYVLDDDGQPVATEDVLLWGLWFEQAHERRVVARTQVGPYQVSTVFLGLDHDFTFRGPPVLWETMVFRDDTGGEDYDCRRYSSRQDAIDGHAITVALVGASLERLHKR